jgi:hypothetical protein
MGGGRLGVLSRASVPRPLVLVGADVVVKKGFRTGEAKDAFGVG